MTEWQASELLRVLRSIDVSLLVLQWSVTFAVVLWTARIFRGDQ